MNRWRFDSRHEKKVRRAPRLSPHRQKYLRSQDFRKDGERPTWTPDGHAAVGNQLSFRSRPTLD